VLLFDGGPEPLATFGPELSARAADSLHRLGVELHMNTMVTHVDGDGIVVRGKDGAESAYDAATVLWTAGVEAPAFATAVARATGAQQDRAGRILVQDDLTIAGHPEISVIGDVMSLRKLPGVAEVAMQSGLYAGRRVRRELEGQPELRSFKYRDLGLAAYIARGDAVVSAGPVHISGFLGWWAWLFIHIAFLTGYRNRVGAILTWWLAFTRDIRRERAYTTRQVGHVADIYEAIPTPAGQPQPTAQPPHPRSGNDAPAQQASSQQGRRPT
jgi:NADH dehydrogenase